MKTIRRILQSTVRTGWTARMALGLPLLAAALTGSISNSVPVAPATWQTIAIPDLPADSSLGRVWARTRNEAYVWANRTEGNVRQAFLFRWNGANWEQALDLTNHSAGQVFGTGNSDVFLSTDFYPDGSGGQALVRIYRSIDKGKNWTPQVLPAAVTNKYLNFGYMGGTPNNVHVHVGDGYILRFDGVDWKLVFTELSRGVYGLTLVDTNEGYYVTCGDWGKWNGTNWVFRGSANVGCDVYGGMWGKRDSGGPLSLYAIGQNNFNNGVHIWGFDETHQTWAQVYSDGPGGSGTGNGLGLWGSASNDVYAVGELISGQTHSGRIYHFNGTSWSQVTNVGTIPRPGGIGGSAADDVWVSLVDGRMLHYGLIESDSLMAYVSNSGDDTVSMISMDTLRVVDTIRVGDFPGAMVLTPDGSRLYVANMLSDNVSVIDTFCRSVIRTVSVGDSPWALTVSRDGRHVYVVNSGSSNISVIGTAANIVEVTVPTPPSPGAIAYHPVRDELWLGFNSVGTVLAVLSADNYSTLASRTSSDRFYGSYGLNFTPDGSEVFGTEGCGCCGRFHRISGAHLNGSISILQQDLFSGGNFAVGVAVHPSNGTAYFAQQGHCSTPPNPRISELGGANRRLSLVQPPKALAITPDGDRLCIVGTNALLVVDLATFATVTNISVGAWAQGIAVGRKLAAPPTDTSVEPYVPDANTVLIDHFDNISGANIMAFVGDGAPCGPAKPSATPSYSFGPGPAGLDQAITLAAPVGAPAGSRTYLKYPGGELLSPRDGTLECWVHLANYDLGIHQFDYVGECQGDVGGLSITPSGQLRADIWYTVFNPFNFDSGTNIVPLNAWTHVALSWGGTGAKLYINGSLVGTHPNTGGFASWFGYDSVFVFLGSSNHLDEVRISNVQRTTFNLPTRGVLTTISVAPTNPVISTRQTQQFRATGEYSDGSQLDLSQACTWTSFNPAVATIDATGLASPNSQGYTIITACITTCYGSICTDTWLFVTNMPPIVTKPPLDQSVRPGSEVTWCVVVSGSEPMTYQWQFNGTNIAGATSNCLMIANASLANAGVYSCIISNPFGTITNQAALSLVELKMFAGLIISGPPGNYRIECQDDLDGATTWTILGTYPVSSDQMPFYYFDKDSPNRPRRFYRAVWVE